MLNLIAMPCKTLDPPQALLITGIIASYLNSARIRGPI